MSVGAVGGSTFRTALIKARWLASFTAASPFPFSFPKFKSPPSFEVEVDEGAIFVLVDVEEVEGGHGHAVVVDEDEVVKS